MIWVWRFTVFCTVDGDAREGEDVQELEIEQLISSKKLRMCLMQCLTYGYLSLLPVIATNCSGHRSTRLETLRAAIMIPLASVKRSYSRNSCFFRHLSRSTSAL